MLNIDSLGFIKNEREMLQVIY